MRRWYSSKPLLPPVPPLPLLPRVVGAGEETGNWPT
eukprot:CAMPEP_0119486916 /NCGR_PEP_ID=MMETSP1344-20130328/13163_1 /TAXON_ID=236787 /ORGANISM="Florenciella parvula, Strain CCMP2471" /LENGTH=35 /DNA_ID= /DNA_START= /DNA_END= /DNA_ORIENTATION=